MRSLIMFALGKARAWIADVAQHLRAEAALLRQRSGTSFSSPENRSFAFYFELWSVSSAARLL